MLAIVGLAALLLQPPQDAPRMRSLMPNGAVVLAERVASPYVVVSLFASTRGVAESAVTHGQRHLLEHLAAKGSQGTLDRRLEAEGAFLTAATGRDSMEFTVWAPPSKVNVAIAALMEVLDQTTFTQEAIDRESRILEQEFALDTDEARLGRAAWTQAYGAYGLDALGSIGAIRKTTPKALAAVARDLFGSGRLALTIVGPIDLEEAIQSGRAFLAKKSPGEEPAQAMRREGKPGRVEIEGAFGEARAAIVPGLLDPRATWSLSAALAVASRFDNAFVTYTPSAIDGLVVLGRTSSTSGLGLMIDSLTPAEIDALYPLGRELLELWVGQKLGGAAAIAASRGHLLSQGASLRPEIFRENVRAMTLEDFREGMASLGPERSVVVVGLGR
ncbi:MAG: insulinase family protein [Fimbriimonadaceae bacterium]|nr:insulinase family protein [Fimbriimonadaceae bacterium]